MAIEKNTDGIKLDTRIVLIIGAGVHRAAKVKSPRGEAALQNLASWSGLQNGFHNGSQLGHTLAWELNALANQDTDKQASGRLEKAQGVLARQLEEDAKRVLSFGWQPPEALKLLLLSGIVSDVISLNVDLVLERWFAKDLNLALPAVRHRNSSQKSKNNQNSDRVREFKKQYSTEMVTFWYPHGDLSKPTSLQFGLSDYAKAINWMEHARSKFKEREKSSEEANNLLTWLDPLLSKRQVLVLGASLDPAEWDLWFALLCRWRNFARHETADWYPLTKILSSTNDISHNHLPLGYVERIEGENYNSAWQYLLDWVMAQGFKGLGKNHLACEGND